MCGLFGVVNGKEALSLDRGRQARDLLQHRGPDWAGEWVSGGIYMAHRRLSIIDPSGAANQPMKSESCVISVNGEIYNYVSLKQELSQHYRFQSDSDSEVVLHGYRHWGLSLLLEKLEGMYAIAIFDLQSHQLHLVRDRVGIKPVYYACIDEVFVWASELKSVVDYLDLSEKDYCSESILDFTTYRYIPAPKTLYKNVSKLEAGHVLTFDQRQIKVISNQYWVYPDCAETVSYSAQAEAEVIDTTRRLISRSLNQQLVSDVPVGFFLSGGVDSSLLVALAAQNREYRPLTYTVGFDDKHYDESLVATEIAAHLEVSNVQKNLHLHVVEELFPRMLTWFDEPFADFSALPTFVTCQHARESVTVALSGDGADELFGGYPRYFMANKLLNLGSARLSQSLGALKRLLGWNIFGRLLRLVENTSSLSGWDWYCVTMGGVLPNESSRLAKELGVPIDYDRYWLFRSNYDARLGPFQGMRKLEFQTHLPEALLAKVDRTSMQCSLEVRVPYLATAIVEYAASLPAESLLRNGQTKYILRKLLGQYLPQDIVNLKKRGFGMPSNLRLSREGRRCSPQFKVLDEIYDRKDLAKLIR